MGRTKPSTTRRRIGIGFVNTHSPALPLLSISASGRVVAPTPSSFSPSVAAARSSSSSFALTPATPSPVNGTRAPKTTTAKAPQKTAADIAAAVPVEKKKKEGEDELVVLVAPEGLLPAAASVAVSAEVKVVADPAAGELNTREVATEKETALEAAQSEGGAAQSPSVKDTAVDVVVDADSSTSREEAPALVMAEQPQPQVRASEQVCVQEEASAAPESEQSAGTAPPSTPPQQEQQTQRQQTPQEQLHQQPQRRDPQEPRQQQDEPDSLRQGGRTGQPQEPRGDRVVAVSAAELERWQQQVVAQTEAHFANEQMKRIAEFGCAHARLLADAKEYVYSIETQLSEQIEQERVAVRAQAEAYVTQARDENRRLCRVIRALQHEVQVLQAGRRRRSRLVITDANDEDDDEDDDDEQPEGASRDGGSSSAAKGGGHRSNSSSAHRKHEDEGGDEEEEEEEEDDEAAELTSDSQSPDIEIVEVVRRKPPPPDSRTHGDSRKRKRRDHESLDPHERSAPRPSTQHRRRRAGSG